MLPYLDGGDPPLPTATGSLHGITRSNLSSSHLAQAAIKGMLCGWQTGSTRSWHTVSRPDGSS